MMAKYDAVNPIALKKLLAGGTKLHGFSPAIMEASYKATKELNAEVAAGNPAFKKIYDSVSSYTATGYQWFQGAEIGFDSFMARHAQS
jgi:TRAP-type mannitol/chloroaromatic compound transport system substrate-binding protein